MTRFPGHPEIEERTRAESRPVRSRRPLLPRLALTLAIALGVLGLMVGIGTLTGTGDGPRDTDTAADPGSTPTPTPSPTPDGQEAGDRRGPARSTSPIYRITWDPGAVDCPDTPRPAPPLPNPDLAGHLREIVDCLVRTHRPMMEQADLTLTVPGVATFSTDVETPCGVISARNFPAFYCSSDETIYVRLDSDEDPNGYARSPMGYWIVMSHEFGHHLQQRAGIFDEYVELRAAASGPELAALSRRLELQANCFSGVFLGAGGDNLGFGPHHGEAVDFYRYIASRETVAATHGSPHSLVSWFDTGYRSRSFAQCVTWDAPGDRVA
ncbi:neutral zinc metallopeptidase [Enemella sp. A6]|uniref:neutral zinc metallopeptidase n=1 Tax=Enemella sp. A6 TaxID=3440152 RepID=UPI003EBA2E7C